MREIDSPQPEIRSVTTRLRRLIPCGALAAAGLPAAAHAAGGDLVLVPDPAMLVALIVLFVLLIAPTNRLILKPLLRVLDEREARTAGTRARAARLEEEAREVLDRCERELAKTREEAERQRRGVLERVRGEAQQMTDAARSEAERALEGARGELAGAFDDARRGLRAQSQDLAREAAARVLGRSL
jgi:F-type H+-transporting ATPase subunit b